VTITIPAWLLWTLIISGFAVTSSIREEDWK
jgi:hypothetical protein